MANIRFRVGTAVLNWKLGLAGSSMQSAMVNVFYWGNDFVGRGRVSSYADSRFFVVFTFLVHISILKVFKVLYHLGR